MVKKTKQRSKSKKSKSKRSSQRAALLLEDGSVFYGFPFGEKATCIGELVFHTSHTGYQEILTDPSYYRQILCFTAAQIGNQGVHPDDLESDRIWASGCLVRSYVDTPRHWRKRWALDEFLKLHKVPGLHGVDTRRLVLHLREKGNQWAVISTETDRIEDLKTYLRQPLSMEGQALAPLVSTKSSYSWRTGSVDLLTSGWKQNQKSGRCVVFDFGVKRQILRYLIDSGFKEPIVVPSSTTAEEVLALSPQLVLLSNGPGDPAALSEIIMEVRKLVGKLPLFGICLGHQILALALGLRTYKLKFGHRGANHPVHSHISGKVEVTSQNHGFAVEAMSLEGLNYSHMNMNDKSVEGFIVPKLSICGIQYHPESSPGPKDSVKIFRQIYDGSLFQMRASA